VEVYREEVIKMGNVDDLPSVTLDTLSSVVASHKGLIQACLRIADPNMNDEFETLLDTEVFGFTNVEGVTFNKRRVIVWQPRGQSKLHSDVSAIAISSNKTIILYGRDGQSLYEAPMTIGGAYTLLDLTINEMYVIFS
jgi:hypothetical protein